MFVSIPTFSFSVSEKEINSLQVIYKKLDFINKENPLLIKLMDEALLELQEKYIWNPKAKYLLWEIWKHMDSLQEGPSKNSLKENISRTIQQELENNRLHLRDQNLDTNDAVSIASILQQAKENNTIIDSISFSYNKNIGDTGVELLMQSMPLTISEFGFVDAEINDAGGLAILEWMKVSQNLQMICIEKNNFSQALKREFNTFKKQNPDILIII